MIKEDTVFILGAGASCPYGLPDGSGLRKQIYERFAHNLSHYYERNPPKPSENLLSQAKLFSRTFENSNTRSIDLFLSRNNEFMEIGKLAIIFSIISSELNSRFREHINNRDHDWYSHIFDKLTDHIIKKEDYKLFSQNKASFITFNYDRSLDHFLFEGLLNSFYGIDPIEIKKMMDNLNIIHLFGQVAGLDWQDLESKIAYKTSVDNIDINKLVKNLRIIYEVEDDPILEKACDKISKAKRIFFLGFGYAPENLKVLKLPEILNTGMRVYGTAFGLIENEVNQKRVTFAPSLGLDYKYVNIHAVDSLMLLRQFL